MLPNIGKQPVPSAPSLPGARYGFTGQQNTRSLLVCAGKRARIGGGVREARNGNEEPIVNFSRKALVKELGFNFQVSTPSVSFGGFSRGG